MTYEEAKGRLVNALDFSWAAARGRVPTAEIVEAIVEEAKRRAVAEVMGELEPSIEAIFKGLEAS